VRWRTPRFIVPPRAWRRLRAALPVQVSSGAVGIVNIRRSSIGFSKANRHDGACRRSRDAWKRALVKSGRTWDS
jgi:hypothetical protein